MGEQVFRNFPTLSVVCPCGLFNTKQELDLPSVAPWLMQHLAECFVLMMVTVNKTVYRLGIYTTFIINRNFLLNLLYGTFCPKFSKHFLFLPRSHWQAIIYHGGLAQLLIGKKMETWQGTSWCSYCRKSQLSDLMRETTGAIREAVAPNISRISIFFSR